MKNFILSSICLLYIFKTQAQDYHAVEGSSFAGSLGVGNNPASIVETPFPWDLDIMSFQFATATNAYTITNLSLISPGQTSYIYTNTGYFQHYADINFNLNLLNARIALNRKHAIAFGANFRSYTHLKTSAFNINDTLKDVNEFLQINPYNNSYSAQFMSSSWLELFLTYSQTVWENYGGRLNAGFTLRAMRGLSGFVGNVQNGTVGLAGTASEPSFLIRNASATYGYSSNLDQWQNSNSFSENLKSIYTNSRGGLSLDLGFEYLVKPQGIVINSNEDDDYDYDWKIGFSILDLGVNQYAFGLQSRTFSGTINNLTDTVLNNKIYEISNLQSFNDSLATIVNGFSTPRGKLDIINPTRVVINVDHSLGNDFYINGNLSLNISNAIARSKYFYVQELNLLTLTPRWERKNLGAYLPIQYNAEGQFLVGGAIKAGPLILGIHNWGNVFEKNKILNGGGYLALVIHPSKTTKEKKDKRFDCPTK